jgi:hypothetical protein
MKFRVQINGLVFAVLIGGDFKASTFLLDEFWDRELREFVKGEFAAVIPARDVLDFCDTRFAEGVVELQQVIDRVWPTGDHLISNKIYVRRPTGWQVRQS